MGAQPAVYVRWADGRLDVSAQNAKCAEVLSAVAQEAGVDIVGAQLLDDACSIELSGARLEDTLKRLAGDHDYVMTVPEPQLSPPRSARVRMWLHVPPDQRPVPTTGLEPGVAETSTDDPDLSRLEAAAFFERANEAALLDAAASGSVAVRVRALQALSNRNAASSLDASLAAVDDADRSVNAIGGVLIAGSDDPRALDSLRAMLRDPNPDRRLQALEWLQARGDPDIVPEVQETLNDSHEAIRTAARRLVETLDGLQGAQRPR